MKLELAPKAYEDLLYFKSKDPKTAAKILWLIDAIIQDPFKGPGKPEPLKYALQGKWSRRINHKDRLVYEINKNALIIYQCRYHY